MSIKKKLLLKLGPKLTGRIISALLSITVCVGTYHIFSKAIAQPSDTPSKNDSLSTEENNGTSTGNVSTSNDLLNSDSSSPSGSPLYSFDSAEILGSQLSSSSALLCNNQSNKVLCTKSEKNAVSASSILALTVALAVIEATENGTVSPSDRAVCPASAVRLPCYSTSSDILSIGRSLTVAELVKTMFCTSPELFAYTLAVHISGSEQAFISDIHSMLFELGASDTKLYSLCDLSASTTTATDAALIFRAATENETLLRLLSSRESFTVSAGGSAWDTVTLCGRFYSECCTEGQAKADGIICGYYGEYNGRQFTFMLFEQLGTSYITVALDSNTAYADSLILLARSVK